jgi:hypothetical protein
MSPVQVLGGMDQYPILKNSAPAYAVLPSRGEVAPENCPCILQ